MMKAAVYHRYGAPEVLQVVELKQPVAKDNEVLIQIKASSVSAGDWHMRKADPFAVRLFNGLFKPRIKVLGSELAGVVVSTGKNVSRFHVGDAVFGATGLALGANAEYLCLSEDAPIAIKPTNLNFKEAAAIPFGAITAHYFLHNLGEIKRGQRVLIYGASGSVGLAAVQLAKHAGAIVTAVCSEKNHALVKKLGADETIDYKSRDYSQSDQRWHIIMDTVGKTDFSASRRVLTDEGLFLASAGGLKEAWQVLLSTLRYKTGFSKQRIKMGIAIEQQKDIEHFSRLISAEHLQPVIDSEYLLEDICAAHHRAESGRKAGTLIINF